MSYRIWWFLIFQDAAQVPINKEVAPQKRIGIKFDCSLTAVSKYISRKFSRGKTCGRIVCTSHRELQPWEDCELKLSQDFWEPAHTDINPTVPFHVLHVHWSALQSPVFRWNYIFHFTWKWNWGETQRRDTEANFFEVQSEVSLVSDDLGCHVFSCSGSNGLYQVQNKSCCLPRLWTLKD